MGQALDANGEALFADPSLAFEAQAKALERRRALAQQLIAKGMEGNTGSGYQGGKVFIVGNPLGPVAQSVGGQLLDRQANTDEGVLAAKQQQAQAAFDDQFAKATTPAEKQAALTGARNQGLRHDLEKSFYELDAKQNEAEAIRQSKVADLTAQREAERAWREQQAKDQREFQAGQNQLYRRTADQLGARVGGQDAELLGLKKDVLRAQIEAATKKHEQLTPAEAKAAAELKAKQDDAASVQNLVGMATGGKQPLVDIATSSGIGAAMDAAGNMLGISSKSADAASQLRAIEGMLISKMPKMSGPQSDKDVLLYRQMAGQIGDPTVPVSRKKAAARTIQEINSRYAALVGAPTDAGPMQVRSAADYNALPSGTKYIDPQGNRRTKP